MISGITQVGPKVADCIALMSMDKLEAVPIDTHMIQIASRDYGLKIPTLSLTDKSYNLIGDHFRTVFGDYAGWAHSVLFAADLKSLKEETKSSVVEIVAERSPIKHEPPVKISQMAEERKILDRLPFKVVKKSKIKRAKILSLNISGYSGILIEPKIEEASLVIVKKETNL